MKFYIRRKVSLLFILSIVCFNHACFDDGEKEDPFVDISEKFSDLSDNEMMAIWRVYNMIAPRCSADIALAHPQISVSEERILVFLSYAGDRTINVCGMDDGRATVTILTSGNYRLTTLPGRRQERCGETLYTSQKRELSYYLPAGNSVTETGTISTGLTVNFTANAGDILYIYNSAESMGVHCSSVTGSPAGTTIWNGAATGTLEKL
ncbi:hypothetical protein EHQ12_17115 [Leptospira gomenensis]|uniref:Lipocalin-like domain-containing protein n=1 Tax=Leptospira gomenensis TaxID=2484974 RepID=A0A5F1YEV5_9LEPT|nr:hypothetical protein [Leptospira gomenensis]TGK33802.1 hypothetical protein EHQ12_17115 [Leptospira gomenensis]TGK36371.1 hypothetical protein EHQ17_04270 [Leptospira gomenensis]TGK47395.1 hypothetical protein EHQ07_06020 [Leptospira gomenensis]TGK60656.1 hypothetical protein EHQ13_10870 [Leptospira gomenensis]